MRPVSFRLRPAFLSLALLATSAGGLSLSASAQPRPDRPASGARIDEAGGKLDRDGRGALREKIHHKAQIWLTAELSSRIGLDERKSLKLSEAIKTHLGQRRTQREKLRAEADKLRGLVDSKAADAGVKAQLDTVLGLAGRDDEVQRFVKDTASFLSPTEQARLALAMPEVMREMRKIVREARGDRRGRHGDGGGGGEGHARRRGVLDDEDD